MGDAKSHAYRPLGRLVSDILHVLQGVLFSATTEPSRSPGTLRTPCRNIFLITSFGDACCWLVPRRWSALGRCQPRVFFSSFLGSLQRLVVMRNQHVTLWRGAGIWIPVQHLCESLLLQTCGLHLTTCMALRWPASSDLRDLNQRGSLQRCCVSTYDEDVSRELRSPCELEFLNKVTWCEAYSCSLATARFDGLHVGFVVRPLFHRGSFP